MYSLLSFPLYVYCRSLYYTDENIQLFCIFPCSHLLMHDQSPACKSISSLNPLKYNSIFSLLYPSSSPGWTYLWPTCDLHIVLIKVDTKCACNINDIYIEHLTAAAAMPVVWAAIGVDFFILRKPSVPHEVLAMDWPSLSVTWMWVLQKRRGIWSVVLFHTPASVIDPRDLSYTYSVYNNKFNRCFHPNWYKDTAEQLWVKGLGVKGFLTARGFELTLFWLWALFQCLCPWAHIQQFYFIFSYTCCF